MASVCLLPPATAVARPWFELGVCQHTPAVDRLVATLCTTVLGVAAPTGEHAEGAGLRLWAHRLTSTTTVVTLHAEGAIAATDPRTTTLAQAVRAFLAETTAEAVTHLRLPPSAR